MLENSYYDHEVQTALHVTDQVVQTQTAHKEYGVQFCANRSCSHQEVHAVPCMRDQMTQTEIEKMEHVGNFDVNHSVSEDLVHDDLLPLTGEFMDPEYAVCNIVSSLSLPPMLTLSM